MTWQTASIGDVIQSSQYGLSLPADPNGNIPIVGMKDIQDGRVRIDEDVRVTLNDDDAKPYLLKDGDILLNRTNSPDLVGKAGIYRGNGRAVFASYLVRLQLNREKADPDFIIQILAGEEGQRRIRRLATRAVSQANLNPTTFKQHFLIPIPPLDEQIRIRNVLLAWDTAIETTERLIAAKERFYAHELSRLISRGQQPRRRFGDSDDDACRQDHSGQWRIVSLSDIATVWKGQQLNKEHMEEDGAYYVLNGGINPSGRTSNWNCEADTITISEGGNSCGFVSYNSERFWCGGHCYALKNLAKDVDTYYLFHYLKGKQDRLMALRVGSGLPNIQKSDVEAFPVVLPDLATQTAIARYLNALREEITLLSRSLAALKRQKRGLMQKLLTGKWRVPVQDAQCHDGQPRG